MNFPEWLVRLSIWVNNSTGGPPGWSLCARLYRASLSGSRPAALAVRAADTLFWFDPGHCRKAWLMRRSL